MDEIEVDVVGAQIVERAFHLADDILKRRIVIIAVRAGDEADLR